MNKLIITVLLIVNYQIFSQNFWQQTNGPYDSFSTFAVNNDGEIFAGARGIYKFDKSNNIWIKLNFPDLYVTTIFISSNGYIFAGATYPYGGGSLSQEGTYRSTDNGQTWTLIQSSIADLIIEKSNGKLFSSTWNGLFSSTNYGYSWQSIGLDTVSVSSMVIDSLGNIYAGTYGNGIFISTNEGKIWKQWNLEDNSELNVNSILVAPNGNIYVATDNPGLFLSSDNGISWSLKNLLTNINCMIFDSTTNQIILGLYYQEIHQGNGSIIKEGGLYSTNTDFSVFINSLGLDNINIYSIIKSSNNNFYVLTSNGFYKNKTPSLNSWDLFNNKGLNTTSISSLVSDTNGYIYADGTYRSTDNGNSWEELNSGYWGTACAIDKNDRIFAAMGKDIIRSLDGGYTWQKVYYGSNDSYGILSIAINSSGVVYAGDLYTGLIFSPDHGDNWLPISGLPSFPRQSASLNLTIAFSPHNILYVGYDQGLFYSKDGIGNWKSSNLNNVSVLSVAFDSTGYMYCGTGFLGGTLFRSSDGGNTWNICNTGFNTIGSLYPRVTNIIVNSQNEVFAGTDFGGVYRSSDHGSNWIATGLNAIFINSMTVNKSGYLFAATEGLGIYRSISSTLITDQSPFLHFPLQGETSYTATINSVFDHSMSSPYTRDGLIIAYTGEEGNKNFGVSPDVNGHGYKDSLGTPFTINGHYSGGGLNNFLYYDGHPGYDYRAYYNTPVLADADGIIHYPISFPGINNDTSYHTLAIIHGNGYITYYLHLSSYPSYHNEIVEEGDSVKAGQLIGYSGDAGVPGSPHLHYEIQYNGIPVDPYGWQGKGSDPYLSLTGITNVNLWLDKPITSVNSLYDRMPSDYSISQNYPNPFNPSTRIKYSVPKTCNITIKVYDILGREVSTLLNEVKQAGNYEIQFSGTNLASGIYFYQMRANGFVETKKFILMK